MKLPRRSLNDAKPRDRRRARKRLLKAAGISICGLLPFGVIQLSLYRQNLAVAREPFPAGPQLTARDRILILSPHCDDETLGAGGTIAAARTAGAQVRVVFLTNGDGSRSTEIVEDARQMRRNSFQQIARMRQREALAALHRLGVEPADAVFLGYPDGGTQTMWEHDWSPAHLYRSGYTGADHVPYGNAQTPGAAYCGEAALRDVTAALEAFRPTVVITTHPADTHPDHWAAYAYLTAALEQLRLRPETADWAAGVREYTFLVHHGMWPAPHGYAPMQPLAPPADLKDTGTNWMQEALPAPDRAAKEAALNQYVSQLAFTPQFLRSFLRINELFGEVPPRALDDSSGPNGRGLKLVDEPVGNSLVHDLCSGGNLKGLKLSTADYVPLGVKPDSGRWLQIRLAGAPTGRIVYRVALHTVTASRVACQSVEVRRDGAAWTANIVPPIGRVAALAVQADAGSLWIRLPANEFDSSSGPASFLVSAGTYLGSTRIDQSETAVLRYGAPTSSNSIDGKRAQPPL